MRNEEYDTIDLMKLFEIVKKNFSWFLVVIFLTSAIALSLTSTMIEKKYSATATFIIVQKDNALNNQTVTYSDLQLSQKLVNTYAEILKSEAICDEVVTNLRLETNYGMNTKALQSVFKVSGANDTEVVNVNVETTDPRLSASIANELVSVFKTKIYDIMQVENITILNNAKVPTSPSGPSVAKNTVLGAVVGFVMCMGYAVFVLLTDTKVKTEEDVKNIFDYPVIGIIPEFEVEEGKKK